MRTLTLRCGRQLAWREYGSATGFPIVFMHGNLNSRLFEPAWENTQSVTSQAGARVIAVDRPGYGGSNFNADRKFTSWPAEVRELADHLDLGRFAVLGFSSGGPNALACAADACSANPSLLPDRLAACGLISSDGPYHKIGGAALVSKMYGVGANPTPAEFVARAERSATRMRSAYETMKKSERRAVAFADLDEAVKQGLQCGSSQDSMLEGAVDWGFELSAIDPRVVQTFLWHGEEDSDVPCDIGRYVAAQLGDCQATFLPGENHTLLRRHWRPILEQLVVAAGRTG